MYTLHIHSIVSLCSHTFWIIWLLFTPRSQKNLNYLTKITFNWLKLSRLRWQTVGLWGPECRQCISTVFLLPSARAPLPTFWLYTCVQGRAERSQKGAILSNINYCRWNNCLILTAVVLAELYFLVKEKGSRRLLISSVCAGSKQVS